MVGLGGGDRALVVNGLVIGPLADGEAFADEDISLMEKLVVGRGAQVRKIREGGGVYGSQEEYGRITTLHPY